MKKRRLIALAAAAVMAATSLTGCGGSQTSSTTAAGSTAETAAASSNAVSPDAKSTDQTLGGGIAVAAGAPAAIGATSEDPKAFGKALIFVALAESIALYGLLISFSILG